MQQNRKNHGCSNLAFSYVRELLAILLRGLVHDLDKRHDIIVHRNVLFLKNV